MSEQDLIEQLGNYGQWLESELGLSLSPTNWMELETLVAFDGAGDGDGDRADSELEPLSNPPGMAIEEVTSGPSRLRVRSLALLGVLLAAGVGVLGLVRSAWSDQEVVTAGADAASLRALADYAPDPPGSLFVLPDPEMGFVISNADSWPGAPLLEEAELTGGATFAVFDGETYRDSLTVSTGRGNLSGFEKGSLSGFETELYEEVQAPGGVALLGLLDATNSPIVDVLQQRDGHWIGLSSAVLSSDQLIGLLADAVVDSDGTIRVSNPFGLTLMESYVWDPAAGGSGGNSFNFGSASDGSLFTIETASAPSVTPGASWVGGVWRPEVRQGRFAWVVEGGLGDQGPNTVAWQATPNWVVLLSGFVPVEEIWEVMLGIDIADEETWREVAGQ